MDWEKLLVGICRSSGMAGRADELAADWRRLAHGARRQRLIAHYGPRAEVQIFAATPHLPPTVSTPDKRALLESLFKANLAAGFSAWHQVSYSPDGAPRAAIHFDAGAQPRWKADGLVEEALVRLGFAHAWPQVAEHGQRGVDADEIAWWSFDLASGGVEVAWRHNHVAANEPLSTRLRFSDPRAVSPSRVVELPLSAYPAGEADAARAHYAGALERVSGHDPHRSVLLAQDGAPEWTIVCAYGDGAAQPAPREQPLQEAEEIVRRYENDIVLANHPFLSRLRREPVNLGHMWVVLANFWESIVHDFPGRLAKVIANLDDDRLRSVFVKQLNDELGEGDYTRAHKAMFRTLLDAVAPWRPKLDDEVVLAPARRFGRTLERHLFAADYHEAVGALMMVEIYGKQIDILMGDQFRRQNSLDEGALTWLRLHETLEVDHADDSLRLAHMLPRAGDGPEARAKLATIWRGAMGVVDAGHVYFNELYQVCFR